MPGWILLASGEAPSPSKTEKGHDRSAVPRGLDSLVKLMMRSIKLEKVKPIV